jgi:hypothetical protein
MVMDIGDYTVCELYKPWEWQGTPGSPNAPDPWMEIMRIIGGEHEEFIGESAEH